MKSKTTPKPTAADPNDTPLSKRLEVLEAFRQHVLDHAHEASATFGAKLRQLEQADDDAKA